MVTSVDGNSIPLVFQLIIVGDFSSPRSLSPSPLSLPSLSPLSPSPLSLPSLPPLSALLPPSPSSLPPLPLCNHRSSGYWRITKLPRELAFLAAPSTTTTCVTAQPTRSTQSTQRALGSSFVQCSSVSRPAGLELGIVCLWCMSNEDVRGGEQKGVCCCVTHVMGFQVQELVYLSLTAALLITVPHLQFQLQF